MTPISDLRITIECGNRRVELSGADLDRPGFRVIRGFLQALVSGEEGAMGIEGLSPRPNANASEQRVLFSERSGGEGVQGTRGIYGGPDVDSFAGYLADALDDDKSLPWYRKVVARLPRELVLDALHRAREASDIRRSRAALFTSIVRPHLKLHPRRCPPDSTPDANPE